MKTILIAEVGVNHNGSIERALDMIKVAADCGVEVVKFQAWKAENLVSKLAERAEYQVNNTGNNSSQLELLRELELESEDYFRLKEECEKSGVEFLCTPMDIASIKFLCELGVKRLKLPSGEITNAPYLLEVGKTNLPLIVSTGMCSISEIEAALGIIIWGRMGCQETPSFEKCQNFWNENRESNDLINRITLLHCTTEYPAPFRDINLSAMKGLEKHFGLPIGYSDHSQGINVSIAAAALGATIIEKHFTLDRNLPGPDHLASIEPKELKLLVEAIGQVNECLGVSEKKVAESEIKNMSIARKSLIAAQKIKKGEVFSVDNLAVKRPGHGISPWNYWNMLGEVASRDYDIDQLI